MVNVKVTSKNFAIVLKSAETLNERVELAAGRGLARGLEYTVGVVQEQYLSGPRPHRLDVRTTRLRQSITAKVAKTPRGVVGRIGTNVSYGAFHEFGFHGTVNVRPHLAAIRQIGAKGKALSDNRRKFVDKYGTFIGYKESLRTAFSRRKGEIISRLVSAHTRQINYKGRPFVRPALEIYGLPQIKIEIDKELAKLT